MKKAAIPVLLALLGTILPISAARAENPKAIYYQGALTDLNGQPMPDGSYTLIFTFYDAPSGGNKLWEEKQRVTVQGGEFMAAIGAITPLDLAFDKPSWLGIALQNGESDPERIEFALPSGNLDPR
jgi:hypothetical protein